MPRFGLTSIAPLALAALVALAPDARGATPQARDLAGLQAAVERVAAPVGGTVGLGVVHIESGRELILHRGEHFPMGSVFKLALAVQLLALVDQGAVDLDKTVLLQASDLRPGSSPLAKAFSGPRRVTLRELLEKMMIDSDNSATDVLWKVAGGSQAVRARLGALGIRGISVDRPTGLLLRAAAGLDAPPARADLGPAAFEAELRDTPRAKRSAEVAAFLKDRRDTATPESLVELLRKVWRGQALSPARTAQLIDLMARCETGKRRLKGGLPPGTWVAHKTGTLQPHVVNDAGIIALPGRAGHVAVVVLVKGTAPGLETHERAIADIARLVYEHFRFNPRGVN